MSIHDHRWEPEYIEVEDAMQIEERITQTIKHKVVVEDDELIQNISDWCQRHICYYDGRGHDVTPQIIKTEWERERQDRYEHRNFRHIEVQPDGRKMMLKKRVQNYEDDVIGRLVPDDLTIRDVVIEYLEDKTHRDKIKYKEVIETNEIIRHPPERHLAANDYDDTRWSRDTWKWRI